MEKLTVLPSIHDMFPDHLLPLPVPSSSRYLYNPSPLPQPKKNLHRPSEPLATLPHPLVYVPPQRTYPPSSYTSDDDDDDNFDNPDDRKHLCTTCGKRFNRPSSLRIHMNTHTGATPFSCPFPGCGRTFNVNSNMRRHYRNHQHASAPPAREETYTHHADLRHGYEEDERYVDDPVRRHHLQRTLQRPNQIPSALGYPPSERIAQQEYQRREDCFVRRPGWEAASF